jgi:hypothetical protein
MADGITISVTEDVTSVTVTEDVTTIDITPSVTTVEAKGISIANAGAATAITYQGTSNTLGTGGNVAAALDHINTNGFSKTLGGTVAGATDFTSTITFTGAADFNNTVSFASNIDTDLALDSTKRVTFGSTGGGNLQYKFIKGTNGANLELGTGETTTMFISNSGNVGIGAAIPTSKLDVDGTITGTTFSGDLNGTINTATTATTQSQSDNSTKVATTAYVDTAVAGKDNTDEITEGSSNLYFTNARADARISNAIKDEDNMASDSATHVPSQQSVKAYVDTEVAGLVDSAPGTLNTLNELAAALGDDASFSTTVTNSIAAKLPLAGGEMTGNITFSSTQTVDGRDLSVDGAKLDGIEASADVTDATNVTAAGALMDSELTDLAGVKALDTSTLQLKPSEGAFENGDKTKLDGIEASADVTDATNVTAAGALMDSELTDLAGVKALDTSTLQLKPSEGAFANGDKTKLDGIEASADVTDATNVAAAGALMDSELTDLAGVKALDTSTLQLKPSEGAFANGDKTKLDGIETGADAVGSTPTFTSVSLEDGTDDWAFTVESNNLIIKKGSTKVAKLDTSGNLTVIGNVTAFGTIS